MPLDRNLELQRLAVADRHLSEAERAVSRQVMEIERLREGGHNTALALQTLQSFQHTLTAMQEHRNIIIRAIEGIDDGSL
jgi:hypothetical protein